MENNKELIKGQCENCGFCFEGVVTLIEGAFPTVICPKCSKETLNFDSAIVVDASNKAEGSTPEYERVIFPGTL